MATDETQNNDTTETATEVEETAEAATDSPVRDSGPVEAVSGEPGGSLGEASSADRKSRSRRHVPRSERRQRSKPKREPAATRKAIVRLPKPEGSRGRRQERRGVVVSDSSDKTIVVKVDLIKLHPKYKKVVRSTVKFKAHDERNEAGIGDIVRIVETRPLSKTKNWRLAQIVEKAR
jgi:small subunit ribosomal protein S17